jgi:hypothetical protein
MRANTCARASALSNNESDQAILMTSAFRKVFFCAPLGTGLVWTAPAAEIPAPTPPTIPVSLDAYRQPIECMEWPLDSYETQFTL